MNETIALMNGAGLFATGVVSVRRKDGTLAVKSEGKTVPAAKAAGCLLEPAKGDLVLLVRAEDDRRFVVQVLARGESRAEVNLPDGAVLSAGGGGGELEIRAGELSLVGGLLKTAYKRVSAVAGIVEAKAELMRETYRRRYEDVEEVKDSRLGRLRCVVEGLLSLRGQTVDARAKKRMRLDGDSVDIG